MKITKNSEVIVVELTTTTDDQFCRSSVLKIILCLTDEHDITTIPALFSRAALIAEQIVTNVRVLPPRELDDEDCE